MRNGRSMMSQCNASTNQHQPAPTSTNKHQPAPISTNQHQQAPTSNQRPSSAQAAPKQRQSATISTQSASKGRRLRRARHEACGAAAHREHRLEKRRGLGLNQAQVGITSCSARARSPGDVNPDITSDCKHCKHQSNQHPISTCMTHPSVVTSHGASAGGMVTRRAGRSARVTAGPMQRGCDRTPSSTRMSSDWFTDWNTRHSRAPDRSRVM